MGRKQGTLVQSAAQGEPNTPTAEPEALLCGISGASFYVEEDYLSGAGAPGGEAKGREVEADAPSALICPARALIRHQQLPLKPMRRAPGSDCSRQRRRQLAHPCTTAARHTFPTLTIHPSFCCRSAMQHVRRLRMHRAPRVRVSAHSTGPQKVCCLAALRFAPTPTFAPPFFIFFLFLSLRAVFSF